MYNSWREASPASVVPWPTSGVGLSHWLGWVGVGKTAVVDQLTDVPLPWGDRDRVLNKALTSQPTTKNTLTTCNWWSGWLHDLKERETVTLPSWATLNIYDSSYFVMFYMRKQPKWVYGQRKWSVCGLTTVVTHTWLGGWWLGGWLLGGWLLGGWLLGGWLLGGWWLGGGREERWECVVSTAWSLEMLKQLLLSSSTHISCYLPVSVVHRQDQVALISGPAKGTWAL